MPRIFKTFEENLKLPHYVQVAVEFVYIGKYLPNEQTGTFTIILEMGNYEIVGIIEDEVIFRKKITVSEFDLQAEFKKIKF